MVKTSPKVIYTFLQLHADGMTLSTSCIYYGYLITKLLTFKATIISTIMLYYYLTITEKNTLHLRFLARGQYLTALNSRR